MDTLALDALTSELKSCAPAALWSLWEQCRDSLRCSSDPLTALALGSAKLQRDGGKLSTSNSTIDTSAGELNLSHWTLGDAFRALLYAEAVEHHGLTLRTLHEASDDRERCAMVQAFALFDADGRHRELLIDIARTNTVTLYAAIALRNPYPAKYYSDHQFMQVVMKSVFLGLDIALVQGLHARANAELAEVAINYAQERIDAQREVPPCLWLATTPHTPAHGIPMLSTYLAHDNVEHRERVAEALAAFETLPAELADAVREQLVREPNAPLHARLQALLAS